MLPLRLFLFIRHFYGLGAGTTSTSHLGLNFTSLAKDLQKAHRWCFAYDMLLGSENWSFQLFGHSGYDIFLLFLPLLKFSFLFFRVSFFSFPLYILSLLTFTSPSPTGTEIPSCERERERTPSSLALAETFFFSALIGRASTVPRPCMCVYVCVCLTTQHCLFHSSIPRLLGTFFTKATFQWGHGGEGSADGWMEVLLLGLEQDRTGLPVSGKPTTAVVN